MSTSACTSSPPLLDLTGDPPLSRAACLLSRQPVSREDRRTLESLTVDESPRERMRKLSEVFRRLDVRDSVELLKIAGRLGLEHSIPGLRLLFGFLEVRRPGSEVLRQIHPLSSIERVSLKLVNNAWRECEGSQEAHPAFAIVEVLEEGARVGALDLRIPTLPHDRRALPALYDHLRSWFRRAASVLEKGGTLPEEVLRFLTQVSMLEISMTEKRVSRLAGSIDPYDVRGMARLMPILSRYDQDIEHMKNVVARVSTYEPFFQRLLTMEHVLSLNELTKILKTAARDPMGQGIARVLAAMRSRPMLDREFVYQSSQMYQISLLRSRILGASTRPDILSSMLRVIEYGDPVSVYACLEEEVIEAAWETLHRWGARRVSPTTVELQFRDDFTLEFMLPDGTPRLPERPDLADLPELSVLELVRMQMQNDAFILGILDNPRATGRPGVVSAIASQTRSLRVLDKIMQVRSLFTGTNQDVPRLLLTSPARIPVRSLFRFIHVRFVNKNDLTRMARPHSEVRSEVRAEIQSYLKTLH